MHKIKYTLYYTPFSLPLSLPVLYRSVSSYRVVMQLVWRRLTRFMEKKEEGYSNVDGSNPYGKAFSPSSMTPLSETGGFAQRNDLRGY